MAEAETKIKITGDSSKAKKAFLELGQSIKVSSKQIVDFTEKHQKAFRTAALVTSAAMGAITAAAVKAIKSASEQEKAEMALASALKVHGDNVARLIPQYRDFASAVQRRTIVGDEEVLQLMALLRNYGVMPQQMKLATEGVIGLAKALDMDTQSSARYVAMALQGEYTILQRYLPALRTATTDTEKHNIVMEAMRQGYQQAQDEASTLAGQFQQLQNAIGDVWEELGMSITQTDNMTDAVASLKEKVISLSEFIRDNREAVRNLGMAITGLVGTAGAITALGAILPSLARGFHAVKVAILAMQTAMIAMPYAAMAAGLATLTAGVYNLANAWVTARDEQAKTVNKEVSTGKIWDERAKQLRELKKDSDKYYYGLNLAVSQAQIKLRDWGLTGSIYTVKTIEDLDRLIAMFEKTGQASAKLYETKEKLKAPSLPKITAPGKITPTEISPMSPPAETIELRIEQEREAQRQAMELMQAKRDYELAITKDVVGQKLMYIAEDLENVKEGTVEWYKLQTEKVELIKQLHDEELKLEKEKSEEIARLQKEELDAENQKAEQLVNLYNQTAIASIQAGESVFQAMGKGLKAMLHQVIQEKILELMAEQTKVIAIAIMNAIPTFGASLSAIPPALAQVAAGTAALKGLEAVLMAEGGIVKRPTRAIIGEAGPEAVIPLNRGGLGNYTYNFQISERIDLGLVTEAIRRGNPQAIGLAKQIHKVGRFVTSEV
ncbi:MAG: hypothetical protein AB1567_04180 [bacterium]